MVNQNQMQNIYFDLKTYRGSIQQHINKWEKRKKLSLIGTVAFIGAGLYFQQSGNDYFNQYKTAGNEDDAIAFRNSTEQADMTYTICIGVGATLGVSWLYSWVQEHKYRKRND